VCALPMSCLGIWLPFCRFIKCLQDWKQKLQDIGYDSIVFEDPLDMLLQQMQVITALPRRIHSREYLKWCCTCSKMPSGLQCVCSTLLSCTLLLIHCACSPRIPRDCCCCRMPGHSDRPWCRRRH
jgi:hypothetical protein